MEMLHVVVGLGVLCLSYSSPSSHKALLMGLEADNRIPEEYIITLIPDTAPLSVRLDAFNAYVSRNRLLGLEVRGKTQMREFAALLVRADDVAVEGLRQYKEIRMITTNTRTKASSQSGWTSEVDTGKCSEQETAEVWGLARTSYRDKPTDFNSAKYSYNSQSGKGVTAYVLDSGIYTEHEDFEGRASRGFVASNLTDEGDGDLNGHGTHVAGTIGGTKFGIAKAARLVAVKVVGEDGAGNIFAIIEGLAWTCNDFLKHREEDRKFKAVINMSLGGRYQEAHLPVYVLSQLCVSYGLVFVVAAGNDGDDACEYNYGRMSSTITVGATNIDDAIADFSNWGICVDILAPGVNISSAGISEPSSVVVMNGTSMAAPHVAGVVARYLSGLHELPSPAQVKAWILDMSVKNKIDLRIQPAVLSTPNHLVYIPCATVGDSEEEDSATLNSVLAITSVTLSFVCLLLVAAIAVGASWGYTQWKKGKNPNPYVQETSSAKSISVT